MRVKRKWGVYKGTVRENSEDEMVKHLDKIVKTQSIQEYLQLYQRAWFVEFDVSDFGASLSTLFELPRSIYHSQAKAFFRTFIDEFLQNSTINFVLKNDRTVTQEPRIDLAIIGHWENKEFAIPLWIMNDILIGFEIIPADQYYILDTSPLEWKSPYLPNQRIFISDSDNEETYVLDSELFQENILYLKIARGSIFISDFNQETALKFFERIASTVIPEIDETNQEE